MSPESGVDEASTSRDAPSCGRSRATDRWAPGRNALLFVGLSLLLFAVYLPSLGGSFLSDDFQVLVNNPYVNALSIENLLAIFDPSAAEKSFTGNYAPIDEILTAIERHFFGDQVFLYHLVNLLLHALNTGLLIAWLRGAGLPAPTALLGGLFFALHPANVEAVAWMSQLKTVASLSLSLAALLAFRSAPLISTVFFGAALLTKASALFALPAVAAWTWVHPEPGYRHWRWVAVWALVFALYAIPEFASFQSFGAAASPGFADGFEQLRSMAAFFSRYAAMATTSHGLSAFHEPAPARSLLDPWWLAALPLLAGLAWRAVAVLRSRREEAVFWVAAAAGYAPISQIFPFLYPMGDRYLYFVLPGLIGALSLLGVDALARARAGRPGALPAAVSRGAVGVAVGVAIVFGLRSNQRAAVWRDETRLFLDAERHYPNGGPASLLQARRAAQVGDADAAVVALARAEAAGLGNFMVLPSDPGLAPIAGSPAFRDFVRGMAGRWIERSRKWPTMNQAQYHLLAHAHMLRDELPEAREALTRALDAGGPQQEELRAELKQLRGESAAPPVDSNA
ncbi:MAG: hypothetical protein ACE5FL_04585 [Myxococcota bacterium]